MTVANNQSKYIYDGNGTTGPWNYPRYFIQDADLLVIKTSALGVDTPLANPADYGVTGAGVPAGGYVTTTAVVAVGEKITISGNVDYVQPDSYPETGLLPAKTVERGLDRQTMMTQQVIEKIGRALIIPITDSTGTNVTLPTAALRANLNLGFDASGNVIAGAVATVTVSAAMLPVVQALTLAASRTAYGVDPAVTSLLTAAPALADVVGFSDVSAADAMKKTTLGDVLGLTSALTTATPALTDVVGFSDVSDSNLMKKTTIADVLALGATSGPWTPTLSFTTPGNLTVAYSTRSGTYLDTGQFVVITFNITVSTFTHTTASGNLVLSGLPFAALTSANNDYIGSMYFGGYTKATHTMVTPRISSGASAIDFTASGSGQAPIALATTEVLTGAGVNMAGTIIYRRA